MKKPKPCCFLTLHTQLAKRQEWAGEEEMRRIVRQENAEEIRVCLGRMKEEEEQDEVKKTEDLTKVSTSITSNVNLLKLVGRGTWGSSYGN